MVTTCNSKLASYTHSSPAVKKAKRSTNHVSKYMTRSIKPINSHKLTERPGNFWTLQVLMGQVKGSVCDSH